VASDCEEIDAEILYVDGHLAYTLARVCVHQRPARSGLCSNSLDIVDGPRLVVGMHNCDQDRVLLDGLLHVLDTDPTMLINTDVGDLIPAVLLEILAALENHDVLNGAGDNVLALLLLCHALDCPVDRLCPPLFSASYFRRTSLGFASKELYQYVGTDNEGALTRRSGEKMHLVTTLRTDEKDREGMSGVNGPGHTDVKMISEALALSRPATSERASATACFSLVPYLHQDGPCGCE
jgi:hypothetical protein